jgi:hypothetical protein
MNRRQSPRRAEQPSGERQPSLQQRPRGTAPVAPLPRTTVVHGQGALATPWSRRAARAKRRRVLRAPWPHRRREPPTCRSRVAAPPLPPAPLPALPARGRRRAAGVPPLPAAASQLEQLSAAGRPRSCSRLSHSSPAQQLASCSRSGRPPVRCRWLLVRAPHSGSPLLAALRQSRQRGAAPWPPCRCCAHARRSAGI